MAYDPNLFNVDPYYDDFNESKKFLRVMFKPGYALQAREVTQLQTILQSQIDRFGKHIFENGSLVIDGQVTENYLRFARIGNPVGFDSAKDLIGIEINSRSPTAVVGAKAKIIHAEDGLTSSTVDKNTVIFFEYIDGSGPTYTPNFTLTGTAGNVPVSFVLTGNSSVPVVGNATVISVDSGVRFVDGYFVLHDAQMISAHTVTGAVGAQYRDFNNPTTRIGFKASKSFVSATEDTTLNDPAFGYYNYSAPGADRFKIDLGLTQSNFNPNNITGTTNFAQSDFIEIMRIVDGNVISKQMYPEYAVIEDTLARRTYDESGNYTVEPFDLNITNRGFSPTGATLNAEVGPGKAYVFGYEYETQAINSFPLPKARTTRSYTDQHSISTLGSYLNVSLGNNGFTGFNPATTPLVYFSDGLANAAFNSIGSAKAKALYPSGGSYLLYLYDVSMSGSNTLKNATRIYATNQAIQGAATGQQAFNIQWGGQTGFLRGENQNGLLFELPKGSRLSKVDKVNYATSNFVVTTLPANGGIQLQTGSTNKQFPFNTSTVKTTPDADLFVLSMTGSPIAFTGQVATGLGVLTLTANAPSQTVFIGYSTDMRGDNSSYLRRTKTLSTITFNSLTGTNTDPLTGRRFLYIANQSGGSPETDVLEILALTGTVNGTSNQSLLNYFTFDNGQRDYLYDWSRLIWNSNAAPGTAGAEINITGPISATIRKFTHSGTDGPFTVDSYTCDYSDIPVYVSPSTGRSFRLSDVLDFRPTRTSLAFAGSLSGGVVPVPVGSANDNLFDYSQYLPRTDKIVLGKDRNLRIISGVPSIDATPPVDDSEAMTLYNVTLNGYTVSKDDVQIKRIENRRYTMQDIAQLEDRLDSVEYFTNLSLLEQLAKNSPLLDSNGLEIPKKGILVDGFRGHSISDVQDPMYSASIDFEKGEMRPAFRTRVYRMNTVSSAINITGSSADGIYTISYTTTPLISQPLATTTLNVNPSAVFDYLGFMRTTPDSDFWFDDTVAPVVRVNTDGENDAWLFAGPFGNNPGEARGFGTQWNDWESNWSGIKRTNSSIPDNINPQRSLFVTSSGTRIDAPKANQITPNSIVNTIGQIQVRKDVIPYARNITISATARNLKPLTRVYLFLDGQSVSTTTPSTLTTTASGSLNFSFAIDREKFLAGKKNIRLTDSSTNNLSNTTTAADFIFSVDGTWGNYKEGIITTKTVQTRRESVRSETIVTNVYGRAVQRSGFTKLVGFSDPLSQSFFIDPSQYPSGVYAKKITLFFSSVDPNDNAPLTLVLRPVVNGYPHPSKYIPLSDVTLTASNIKNTVSNTASKGVDFEFSSPIYLAPGEYAFSLTTPSNRFVLYSSQIGSPVIKQTTGEETTRATKQPYARSLFKNQTSSGVQKNDSEDIKFLLHICKFDRTQSSTVKVSNTPSAHYGTALRADVVRYNIPLITPADTKIVTTEKSLITNGLGIIDPNKNIYLTVSQPKSSVNSSSFTELELNLQTNNDFVSPLFDVDRANIYAIENRVNMPSSYNSLLDFRGETASNNLGTTAGDRYISRYITKRVVLEPNMTANNLRVEVLVSKPGETDFQVYARMSPENGTGLPFDLREYKRMNALYSYPNTAVDEFAEMAFSLTGQPDFRVFAIKIVMTSENPAIVPVFKNIRVTSA